MDKILFLIKKVIPKKIFKALQPVYHFSLSWLASLIYSFPSEKLIIIGITGTTGKTTSVYLIAKTLESAGYKVGYTSTAMFNDGNKEWTNDKKMTMMGRFFTQRILRRMIKNKCQYAILETTSQGIAQFRHRFINYDILIFTGLYPEHIEAHGSFENYKKAKGKLFAYLTKCKTKYVDEKKFVVKPKTDIKKIDLNKIKKTIIVNADDEQADYFLGFKAEEKIKYKAGKVKPRVEAEQEIVATNIKASQNGTSFMVKNTEINLKLLGKFNVANAMTSVCLSLSQGIGIEKIKEGLEKIKGVPGRLEKINQGQNFTVIVDYAYEPEAVAKLYETVDLIPHSKIIHVLGSTGGGRDAARRPKLGKIAGEKADFVIVTNEDPYDDDPNIIIDQVAIGAEHVGKKLNKGLFKILDRRIAIKKALGMAQKNDIVLITGKGNEQAICVADGKKIIWDDRKAVREELGHLVRNI